MCVYIQEGEAEGNFIRPWLLYTFVYIYIYGAGGWLLHPFDTKAAAAATIYYISLGVGIKPGTGVNHPPTARAAVPRACRTYLANSNGRGGFSPRTHCYTPQLCLLVCTLSLSLAFAFPCVLYIRSILLLYHLVWNCEIV